VTDKKRIQKATDEQLKEWLAQDLSISAADILEEQRDRRDREKHD
jgi:hypothetical protein